MADQIIDLFSPDLVFFDFEAADQEDFFRRLEVELRERGYIKDSWYDAIVARERNFPTGLGFDALPVAIPHTDPENVARPYMAVIVPRNPIEFTQMAGEGEQVPARLVVNLGIVHDSGQVEALQKLMEIFMSPEACDGIMSQTTGEGMVEAFRRYMA